MHLTRALVGVLAGSALLAAAGCSGPGPSSAAPDGGSPPAAHVPTLPGAPAGNGASPPAVTDAASQRWDMPFIVADARNPRAFFLLDPAVADALLPQAYTPADAAALAGALWPEGPLAYPYPDATGKAVAVFDTSPGLFGIAGGPPGFEGLAEPKLRGWSVVGIFVEPPDVPVDAPPSRLDLFLVATQWGDPLGSALYQALGFPAELTGPVELDPGYTPGPGPVLGDAIVTDADGTYLQWSFAIAPGGSAVEANRYHFWAENPRGTLWIEMVQTGSERAGPLTACDLRAGTPHAEVVGVQGACAPSDLARSFAVLGDGTDAEGTFHWLPGIYAGA